jgi:hypothetical protein
MDDYWMKSENKEVAAKKLDDDMDAYWEKKGKTDESDADAEGKSGEQSEGKEEVKTTEADAVAAAEPIAETA